jgi:hypothetical protein
MNLPAKSGRHKPTLLNEPRGVARVNGRCVHNGSLGAGMYAPPTSVSGT